LVSVVYGVVCCLRIYVVVFVQRALLSLLARVAEKSSENKMTPVRFVVCVLSDVPSHHFAKKANLSIVLSPNVIVANHQDALRAVKETSKCSALFEWMIASESLLFPA
jgi:hypothetical protein